MNVYLKNILIGKFVILVLFFITGLFPRQIQAFDGPCSSCNPFTTDCTGCSDAGPTCTLTNYLQDPCVCGCSQDCPSLCASGGCFVPGTLVNSSDGAKKIEDIKIGDSVSSFSINNNITESSVSDIYKVHRDFYFFVIAGGYSVKVTAEHPFYIGKGQYKEAQFLKTGDVVYVEENNSLVYKVILNNIKINEPTIAYNLSVDNTHTFFANGFAVHNKGCNCFGQPADCASINSCCSGGTVYNENTGICQCPDGSPRTLTGINVCKNTGAAASTYQIVGGCGTSEFYCEECPTAGHPNRICCETLWSNNLVQYYQCASSCSATAPTALAYNTGSQTLTWTAGTGGSSQKLYVSADSSQVVNDCTLSSSPGCVVNNANATSPYSLAGIISPGTVYYAKVVNFSTASCKPSDTLTLLSSCSFPSPSVNVTKGDTTPLALSVNSSSDITNVTFGSSDTGVATVTTPDTTYAYSTNVTGVEVGSATLTSNVYFGAVLACTSTAAVNVLTPDPWWQVMDGDTSSNGNLNSKIPNGEYFDLEGTGGFPGVPAYSGTTNLTTQNVSPAGFGWLAQSTNASGKTFDYQYFANQAPGDTVYNSVNPADAAGSLSSGGVTDTDGYYWYRYSGAGVDLSIDTAVDLGSRKVILFVDSADLLINAPINLTDGSGFLLIIVGKTSGGAKGNIIVSPTVGAGVYDLEGLYMADGSFQTGLGIIPLKLRGSVTGYDGISMQRDLTATGNLTPSEFFEYAPDQILLFPKKLGVRKINWKEVAP